MAAKLTRDFQPNAAHGYNLAPGVVVKSAKFPRQVDIWQEAEPSPIWRGEPKAVVGVASARLWTYVVRGMMSGTATSEAAAMAEGERRATEGQVHKRPRYALSPAAEIAEREAFAAYLEDIRERFQ